MNRSTVTYSGPCQDIGDSLVCKIKKQENLIAFIAGIIYGFLIEFFGTKVFKTKTVL